MAQNGSDEHDSLLEKVRQTVVGAPRNIKDPSIFHKLSLVPLLAWIGLGADGLSSSSYGPEEAFRALGRHTYLAVFLALATSLTVFIISYAYARIIEHFPHGGGGYIVATHTLSPKAGLLSGSALLVDYMLTITVSIAACGDALFSFLPLGMHEYKIFFELFLILFLIVLNLRGVKESVTILAPIFIVFVVTHIFMIGFGILSHLNQMGPVFHGIRSDFNSGLSSLGGLGMLALFLRAYSLGGGTYTGIEAVSNGMQIMREPKVQTGKKTMLYMAVSLAFTASGLFLCYLLLKVTPGTGKTLNAILANALYGNWSFGYALALVTILSEGLLLIVGAQAGFIDGPRIMSNMAIDSWLPHRFASLSERLTMQNGILLMGGGLDLPAAVYRGQDLQPGGHVRDQRFPDLFDLPARHVAVLHPQPPAGAPVEEAPAGPRHRLHPLFHHPDHHQLREVPRGRLDDPADHPVLRHPLLPDPQPLQQRAARRCASWMTC